MATNLNGDPAYQQVALENKRNLLNHEIRIRFQTHLCQKGEPDQSTLPNLLYQLSGIQAVGKETVGAILLRLDFDNAAQYADDIFIKD